MAVAWLVLMVLFPILSTIIIVRNFDSVLEKDFKDKYGELTSNIQTRNSGSFLYTSIFLAHRAAMAMIIVLLQSYPYFQIQLNLFVASLVLIYIGWVRPFTNKILNVMETFNALGVLLVAYFMLMFTDWLPSNKVRYDMGWYMVGVVIFLISFNMIVNAFCTLLEAKSNFKTKLIKHKINRVANRALSQRNKKLSMELKQLVSKDRARELGLHSFI